MNSTRCRRYRDSIDLDKLLINEMYHANNADVSVYLGVFVNSYREDRTMYERILPFIDNIISCFKEFEYKWKFLLELPERYCDEA